MAAQRTATKGGKKTARTTTNRKKVAARKQVVVPTTRRRTVPKNRLDRAWHTVIDAMGDDGIFERNSTMADLMRGLGHEIKRERERGLMKP